MVSERQDVGIGRFSCRLCAPNRPPRLANASFGGIGSVLMHSGCVSTLISSTHTSLGQSAALSFVDSSLTSIRSRLNSGSAVWLNPEFGGQLLQRDTIFGRALSLMSRITAP